MDSESRDNIMKLVVLGVTSYDNQGVVNEIMGKTVYPDISSTTEFDQHDLVHGYNKTRVKLTVAPGFMDVRSNKSPWQMKRDIQYELQKSDYMEGFRGAIMVMRYPFRWTDEERDTVQYALDILKQSNLEKHGFLVLTNGHNFKLKYPENTEKEFQDYLRRQENQEAELKQFLQIFHGRVFLLDTELGDEGWNRKQVDRIFNDLRQIQGTFSIYSAAVMIVNSCVSYIWQAYSYVSWGVSWMVGKVWGPSNISSLNRKNRSESFDKLSDAEECRQNVEPKEGKECNTAIMDEAMVEDG